MCCQHVTDDFTFFCYTDNPHGLDDNIKTLKYVDQQLYPIVFNKLFILNNRHFKFSGQCFFFDLDIVIKNNIDEVIKQSSHTLTVLNASWKTPKHLLRPNAKILVRYYHTINTSCMSWQAGACDWVWQLFEKRKYYYLNKYNMGIDNFIFYQHIPFATFNTTTVCSYNSGHDYRYKPSNPLPDYRDTDHGIILFNGNDEDKFRGMKKFYDKFYPSMSATISSHIP